jgi:flagellar biosynthesis/type III secretory pathway ATPase
MSVAIVRWIAGPVLHAVKQGPFVLRESVRVGPQALLGEVVRIRDEEIVVQVYEDTSGLRPGSEVHGDGLPLSIRVGPGLLGRIFDGLLRPLSGTGLDYVQPGMRSAAAGRWHFEPSVAAGALIAPGAVIGTAAAEGRTQSCLAPPDAAGVVISVVAAGEYDEDAAVCVLRTGDGRSRELAMSHVWPVRTPRPAARRLPAQSPLVTGQRVLDSLFPVAQGGKAAIPGGFGTGKTVLLEALAKGCNADVIVYLGCGERGNEMAGVLEEFPTLTDPRSGRPLMERTVIIANTSNMPVAAREASIYCAITVAEYFRDQGLHVALMADSTSRWAEALREVSGRFGELPGEGGYPAYLSSRLADFYERAALVETLAGGTGSVTGDGRDQPALGRFLRAGDEPHQALREGVLGARREARAGALLSGRAPAAVVRRGRRRVRALVGRAGQRPMARIAPALPDAARRAGAARAHGAHHRQGRATGRAAADAALRRARRRGVPAPVGVLRDRPRVQPGAAGRDDAGAGPIHRPRRDGARRRHRARSHRCARLHPAAAAHGRGGRRPRARPLRRARGAH